MKTLLLAAALAGCVSNDEWLEPEDDGKADDPTAPGAMATEAGDVTILHGFNKLLDQTAAPCLAPVSGGGYRVGNVEEKFDLSLVGSREELARQLDVDLGLKVKYKVVDAQGSFDLLDSFKSSRTSVTFLLRAVQQYRVLSTRAVELVPFARELLAKDPTGFLNQCGNLYINGIKYEAQFHVLIRYEARDEQTANAIKAELAITTPAPISGMVKTALDRTAKRADVSVTVGVASRGFLVSGTPASSSVVASLLGSGVSIETFAKVDELRAAMAASIRTDICRDAGGKECDGPGYEANTLRSASPAGVTLVSYEKAVNAPRAGNGWNGYEEIRKTLAGADRYLRDYIKLQNQVEAVYLDEVDAFLSAGEARKLEFGLAPPAAPVFHLEELSSTASLWASKFRPETGSTTGALDDVILECWSGASSGNYAPCRGTVSDGPVFRAATADLDSYRRTGRVMPLRFRAIDRGLDYQAARNLCAELVDERGLRMRLPGLDEAERMGIPVAHANLPRAADPHRYMIWHAHSQLCGGGPSAFDNPPDATSTTQHAKCPAANVQLPTLCVPTTGPFAL